MSNNFSVIILAAGKSTRMKFPKPFLLIPPENKITFLEKIISAYQKFNCSQIVVVLNTKNYDFYKQKNYTFLKNCTIVINEHLEYERFYSIKLGLHAIETLHARKEMLYAREETLHATSLQTFVFIQNSDNPFISNEVLNRIKSVLNKSSVPSKRVGTLANYIVPTYQNKGGHPILISKKIANHIIQLPQKDANLKIILQKFKRINVDVDDKKILYNINTAEQFKKLM